MSKRPRVLLGIDHDVQHQVNGRAPTHARSNGDPFNNVQIVWPDIITTAVDLRGALPRVFHLQGHPVAQQQVDQNGNDESGSGLGAMTNSTTVQPFTRPTEPGGSGRLHSMSKSTGGWSDLVVQEVVAALTPLADPAKAPAMRAYMKDVAPFLGIPSPIRSSALRPVWKAVGKAPSARDQGDAATELFDRDEREFAYAALDLLGRNKKVMDEAFLVDVVEPLILTKSWWDTVDSLRSEAVGPLVTSYPSLSSVIHRWATSDNRWLVRSAIIHQLGYHERTDVDLLFDLCRMHAHQTEFFIAKGIGWSLREYSYTDADGVEEFIATTELRPLSKREGMKAIVRERVRAKD